MKRRSKLQVCLLLLIFFIGVGSSSPKGLVCYDCRGCEKVNNLTFVESCHSFERPLTLAGDGGGSSSRLYCYTTLTGEVKRGCVILSLPEAESSHSRFYLCGTDKCNDIGMDKLRSPFMRFQKGLRCYECVGSCPEPDENDLTVCPRVGGLKPLCAKTYFENSILRSCTLAVGNATAGKCDEKLQTCYCDTDKCNGADADGVQLNPSLFWSFWLSILNTFATFVRQ